MHSGESGTGCSAEEVGSTVLDAVGSEQWAVVSLLQLVHLHLLQLHFIKQQRSGQ